MVGLLISWVLDLQPGRIPFLAGHLPPGAEQALLGTDHLGRNIALGLLHGIPSILVLAVPSLLLSLLLAIATAFLLSRNIRPRISMLNVVLFLGSSLLILASFPWLSAFPNGLLFGLWAFVLAACLLPLKGPKLRLPLPEFIRLIQLILLSIPGILLLFSINPNSYLELIVLLGGTSWVALGQFSEQTMLKFFNSTEYQSAEATGIPIFRIATRYLSPGLLHSLRPQLAWLLAGFIVLEGSLGYLGIGLPEKHWGWGQMLRLGLLHTELWWSWLFPALCILFTVLSVFVLLKSGQKRQELWGASTLNS
jgi:ABC-type dipeptide/oligopeptide/nickel transport system permease subunit